MTLNLRCARCFYALRGLESDARCPECGLDIADTLEANRRRCGRLMLRARRLRGPLLSRTDRPWLRGTAVAVVLLVFVQIAVVGWYVLYVPNGQYRTKKFPDHVLFWLAVAQGMALLLLTRSEPAGADERVGAKPSAGRILRWIVPAVPAAAGLALASELVAYREHSLYARASLLPALAAPVVTFLAFDHLSHLAARARDHWGVVGLRLARLVATAFASMVVLVGVLGGRRLAEILVDAVNGLLTCGGLGMVCYAAVCGLLLRVGWKLWAGSATA